MLAFAIPSEWTRAQWEDYANSMYYHGMGDGAAWTIALVVLSVVSGLIGFSIANRK